MLFCLPVVSANISSEEVTEWHYDSILCTIHPGFPNSNHLLTHNIMSKYICKKNNGLAFILILEGMTSHGAWEKNLTLWHQRWHKFDHLTLPVPKISCDWIQRDVKDTLSRACDYIISAWLSPKGGRSVEKETMCYKVNGIQWETYLLPASEMRGTEASRKKIFRKKIFFLLEIILHF